MKQNKWLVVSLIAVSSFIFWKCDSDPFFSIGGRISGLDGTVVLQNNGRDDLEIKKNGAFEFATAIVTHREYEVRVKTNPTTQTCSVTKASGITLADVHSVKVSCADNAAPAPTTKKTFITASAPNGNLSGVSGADSLCMGDANYPGTGSYKAMIADSSRHACTTANCSGGASENLDWVLLPNTIYTRADGSTVIGTTNNAGIWLPPLDNTYDLPVGSNSAARIWVGQMDDWTNDPILNCNNWTDGTMGSGGRHARRDAIDSQAINFSNQLCSDNNALLCVEQ